MADFSLDQIADLPLDLFVGGRAVPASDGGRFDVLDPATGEVLASVADGTVDDAMSCVEAASRRGRGLGRDRSARARGGPAPRLRADDRAAPTSSPT